MHTRTGREEIRAAYQDQHLVDDYMRSRYADDPLGQALHEHQARILPQIIRSLGVRRLLEVAPGPGRLTVHAPPVHYACAVEQSAAMINAARQRLAAHGKTAWDLIQGDAFNLPVFDEPFDMVMTFKLIRHFNPTDRTELYRNIRQVLRPGGHLLMDVVNAPANTWLHAKWGLERAWIDDFWFTADGIRQEMRAAGFPTVRLFPIQPALRLQYYLTNHLGRLSKSAARMAGKVLDRLTIGQPLEWMALCQCE